MSRPSESRNTETKERLIAQRFFFLLLISAILLLAFVVKPIAGALFLAAVLAGVLWPLHQRFCSFLRGRQALSAAVLTLGVVILVIGPVVAFVAFAIIEGEKGLTFLIETVRSDGMMGLLARLPSPFGHLAQQTAERLSVRGTDDLARTLRAQMSAYGGNAALALGATLSATGAFLFQAAMTLIALYFLLLQGKQLVSWVDGLSPLKQGQTRELLTEFKRVSFAVILSTVITSAVQAAAALVGYFIASVPHSLFFAGVTFFVAFVPAIGATSVCLVAALLVFAAGHPYAALFLVLWGFAVVGLVDNLIKPMLIHAGMHMNGAVVFFSLIGGLSAFGGVGLLLGPLVVALLLSLLRMYRQDYKPAPTATPRA